MLTRSGLGALVVAVLLIAAAWAWQYEELLIAAAVLTALVGMAVALARRKIRATVRRRVLTPRVARGRPVGPELDWVGLRTRAPEPAAPCETAHPASPLKRAATGLESQAVLIAEHAECRWQIRQLLSRRRIAR